MDVGVTLRRHNPVDSICRKLQTIQRRDQEVNSPFQIPKFQSSSYDSPHSGLHVNLEAILKKRTVRTDGGSDRNSSESLLTPTASPGPGSVPNTPRTPITPGNATYTITSMLGTLGERRNTTTYSRPFRHNCSTPAAQTGDNYFNFTPRYSTQNLLEGPDTEVKTSKIPAPGLFSYNLNFSSDISNMDTELAYPALVVKRLSLGEGSLFPSEPKKESMAEVSLICEEDLLDTIFQACDTQCRGKVYVSHIVDFLRHTTCRSSEDSGLEELCNMLDPEHKDISIDLDTYHAIMKEWIDDCHNQAIVHVLIWDYGVNFGSMLCLLQLLRADKNKLESQMQMMQPDMTIPGLSLSVAYRLNQMSSGSLQTELALAQNPLEGLEHLSSSVCFASSLDVTLDREVLLLLQGPTPEQLSLEYKTLISRLKREFKEDCMTCLTAFRGLTEHIETKEVNTDLKIQGLEFRVQEQENQKEQLQEELDRLKAPLDNRAASSQTPDHLQQVVEELDGPSLEWDEEYVLSESPPLQELGPDQEMLQELCCDEEELQALKQEEEEEVEHTETVEDKEKITERAEGEETLFVGERGTQRPFTSLKEEDRLPECTGPEDAHEQAAPLPHTHSQCADDTSVSSEMPHEQVTSVKDLISSTEPSSLVTSEMVSPSSGQPEVGDSNTGRTQQPIATNRGSEGERAAATADMSDSQRLSEGQLSKVSAKSDKSLLLPVAEEEEAMLEEADVISTGVNSPDKDKSDSKRTVVTSDSNSAASADSLKDPSEKAKDMTFDPTVSEGNLPTISAVQGSKKDPLTLRNKLKKEMSSMEAIEEQKAQEDGEPSVATEKEGDTSVISENASDSTKDDKNSLSPSDKEIEAEFHRLSLGFKCDMFTLEKRLRLEERSRDLAEENVRKEVNSCKGLLQALIPRCEEDNQSMEMIHRLQKNLEVLIQSMTRVSSRSEMLGAIHQETRVGKTVEVMIQHVENLRRMYTKEHAELLELRENFTPNERSFGSHTERDDFRNKKQSTANIFKTTSRRISIATIPRSSGGQTHFDIPKDMAETEVERLSRRSPWNMAAKRPPLKRFISSGTWADIDEPTLMNRYGYDTDSHSEKERKEEPEERRTSITELGIKITSFLMPNKTPSPSPTDHAPPSLMEGRPAVSRGTRGIWIWVALLVVLAVLLALLASLMLQPAVDAAPVGTGDSWMTIQQLLWPYTGLRHNGQPPV
ncbi:inositol 1,4,5-triphosphate receptor associated 2 [Sinocyclocheilus grahami]|uniref:inositol 1,4,5-triphosphate receptor associated 2 n=1 Tax=Sinocyclocheilus grahami TaxID=75366 RepID=UPI0007ACC91C|nr:PREDICTED: lymphoid-restricted membrane protein-like [Sinocyclocheilus grahami]